jgi:TRAP-type transport system periplasmic protein
MKKHLFFALISIAISCIMLSISSFSYAQEKVINLNYSNFFPAPHANSILAEQWSKEIEKRTNGKVKITYFPGGTLTPAAQIYDGVVKGISDIGFSCFAYTAGKFPLLEVIDLPLGYKSGTQATKLVNAFYAKFKPKELDDTKVLILHGHGPGLIHTKQPVNKLEDLKGMKIRSTGLAAKIVTALGGAPVGAPQPETYDALRTGVVDGSMAPLEALQGWKWGEIVRYTTLSYGSAYTTAMFVVMNKAKWNALPPNIQKVFEDVSKEYTDKQAALWDKIDTDGAEFAKQKGVKTIVLPAAENARWATKVKPLLDDYVANMKAKGLPGDEALKFCLDFLKKN